MAHFYGTVQGNRGQASRLGSKDSGLDIRACSWEGAISVCLFVKDGVDWAHVSFREHNGRGSNRMIYDGPVSGEEIQNGL